MEWATTPLGSRVPIDVEAIDREPRAMDVVLHLPSRRGFVVSAKAIHDGDPIRWLGRPDCELRTSHWETCPGAVNHRNGGVNEHQDRLEL